MCVSALDVVSSWTYIALSAADRRLMSIVATGTESISASTQSPGSCPAIDRSRVRQSSNDAGSKAQCSAKPSMKPSMRSRCTVAWSSVRLRVSPAPSDAAFASSRTRPAISQKVRS